MISDILKHQNFAIVTLLSILIVFPTNVSAAHIFEDVDAFAQYLDIAQLSSEKFTITVDDDSYDMYYGYHGSFDSMASDEPQPKLSSMSINQERKSLEITFDEVPSNSVFWVRMPDKVISAEKSQFQLFIDDVETQYELTKFPNDYALGMIIPSGGKHIEIIGTQVIPEFGPLTLTILGLSVLGMVFFMRKSDLFSGWPRIN